MGPLAIKLTHHLQLNKMAVDKIEPPLFTFNKLCYAFLNNDFVMVGSSVFSLMVSITLIGLAQFRHLNINQ